MSLTTNQASDSAGWLNDALAALEGAGLRRVRRTVVPFANAECEIDGRRVVNFASNDYLGLAGDERLREAARAAIEESGVGAGASALVSGRTHWHERLERALAEFEGVEAALLFPTGYAANVGTISALVERGDVVFSDELNHASLIDGCRLSRATVRVYPHSDIDRLEDELRHHQNARRRLIVTDGVFSMDGVIAPLVELNTLAERYHAMLVVDEAHATGVLGRNGRGACEACGIESPNLVRIGTLSKALGTLGGFVSGSRELIEFLWNRARTQVFSTALPPAICAAALAALEIVHNEPERRDVLMNRTRALRHDLFSGSSDESLVPIVPVITGDPVHAVKASDNLLHRGLFVPAIRPPTVPEGLSRLRISLSAAHSVDAINSLVNCLRDSLGESVACDAVRE